MIEKLKQRWNVKNGWDVLIILLVFACTGFSVLYVKRALFGVIGLTDQSPPWLRWIINILIILPLYQVILLAWGWVWGKFSFFWEFEKRMFPGLQVGLKVANVQSNILLGFSDLLSGR